MEMMIGFGVGLVIGAALMYWLCKVASKQEFERRLKEALEKEGFETRWVKKAP